MTQPYLLEPPAISHGASEAPLTAMLHLAARDADQARVVIRQRDAVWTITMPIDGATAAYRLLGLMPSGAAELFR